MRVLQFNRVCVAAVLIIGTPFHLAPKGVSAVATVDTDDGVASFIATIDVAASSAEITSNTALTTTTIYLPTITTEKLTTGNIESTTEVTISTTEATTTMAEITSATSEPTNTDEETTISVDTTATPKITTDSTSTTAVETTADPTMTTPGITTSTSTQTSEPSQTSPDSSSTSTLLWSTSTTTLPTTTPSHLTEEEILEGIKFELTSITMSLAKLEAIVISVSTTTASASTTTKGQRTQEAIPEAPRSPPIIIPGRKRLYVPREEVICTPISPNNDTDLCERLIQVLNNIERFSKSFTDNGTMEQDLKEIQQYSQELNDVVNAIEADEEFVQNHINSGALIDRLHAVNDAVEVALSDIEEMLNPPKKDNTELILLSTMAGIVGVGLIVGGVIMIRKKKAKKGGLHGIDNEGHSLSSRRDSDSQEAPGSDSCRRGDVRKSQEEEEEAPGKASQTEL